MNRFRFLFSLLLEHKYSYLLGSLMVGVTLWMTLTIPLYLEQAIDILRNTPDPQDSEFTQYIIWILLFAIAIMFTRTASRLLFFIPGRRVEFDLKNRLLEHLTTLQRDYFIANPSGSIISRVNNDINGVRMLMGFGLLQLVNSLAMLSMAPYRMYEISPELTLYVGIPLLIAFFLPQIALRRLRQLQREQMQTMQDLSDSTVESYNGLDTLRSYRALDWAEQRFEISSELVKSLAIRMSTIRAFFMPILAHVVNALKVVLVLVGGVMVIKAELSMGQFIAYTLYLSMLLPPLMGMTFMMFVIQRGLTALGSLETVFTTQADVPEIDPAAESALPEQLQTGLSVTGLTYAYPDEPDKPILKDIGFAVRPGEIVGVFGAIGSGKTTLVNIINRYLKPPENSIALDGIDSTKISQAALRKHIVTVSQEPFLFSASIRDNVSFATDDIAEGQVEQALNAAAMNTDLAHFPAGLETIAGEKGINLSGGQKQRIALARSLLKPCDLLILDDVMSAVDHETERHLIEQIYAFQQARSLLIVSHRISVLEQADRIIVLEDGHISASGSHNELIQQPGIYRSAYLMQTEQAVSEPSVSV